MQNNLKRILVLGSGGSGKTTFSRKLAAQTGLPLYHLDALYWKPGWTKTDGAKWLEQVTTLVRQDAWIIDGSYTGTVGLRIPRADLICYLDIPPYRCIWNILKRRVKYARFTGLTRPGMAPGCNETIWFSFLMWVGLYRKIEKPKVFAVIEQKKRADTEVVVFKTYREMERYLGTCP
jgi:adenylate kinase family enzyme